MKKSAFLLAFAIATLGAAFAAPPRLAVGDFTVTSDDPSLKYVGKGLAEMIATELAISKGVSLIDREQRASALGEIEFSLSGLADPASQVEAGRLLAADYLLFGTVVDMGPQVLVACSMIRVSTGEVVWRDKNLGPLSDYDGISRKLAASALKGLGAGKAAAIAAAPKPAPKPGATAMPSAEKKVEAVIAFSGAVAALDKKDRAEAKKQIALAKAIDPGNAAVAAYAAKLAGGSPRFLVELDRYAPAYNPALLGFQDEVRLYQWSSLANPVGSDVGEHNILCISPTSDPNDQIKFKESANTMRVGALVPIGERFGIMAEYSGSFQNDYVGSYVPGGWSFTNPELSADKEVNLDQRYLGGNLGFGYKILPSISIGVSAGASYLQGGQEETVAVFSDVFPDAVALYWSAAGGLAYRHPAGSLSADAQIVWTNQPAFILEGPEDGDYSTFGATLIETSQPLLVSAGAAAGFFDGSLFASIRGILEIGTDRREYFAGRAIPGLEYWPFPWIALRASYEYAYVSVESGGYSGGAVSASGSGFMGGLTLARWGFELSCNYINRLRPLRELPGAAHQNAAFLIGLSYSGLGKGSRL